MKEDRVRTIAGGNIMKEIKFTTNYEQSLSFMDRNFKIKYEERVGNNPNYIQVVDG